ncbi:zinc finger, C2H2 type [Cooperia oncophora]
MSNTAHFNPWFQEIGEYRKQCFRSHTDIRPYNCKECNFSFKTKGNWTKHLNSKTHRKRLVQGSGNDSENDDGLVIASPDDDVEQCCPYNEMDSLLNRSSSDEEADDHLPLPQEAAEVILFERMAHTPPSRWMLADEEVDNRWPDSERTRNCSSAPPSAASPVKEDAKEELMASSTMLSSLAVSVILTLCPTSGSHVQQLQHNHVVQQPTTSIYSYSSREVSHVGAFKLIC